MSTCNSGSTVCTPCGFNGVPDAANESVESALNNFIYHFFGTLTKQVSGGSVVWTLPCNLEDGIEGYPRVEGEGLACYMLGLMEDVLAGAGSGVPTSRTITGTKSVTGGGDLTVNRTLELVNDDAAPGNSKYYGTDGGGTKGYHSLPASATGLTVVFGTTGATTVLQATLAETTLLGAVRAGESKTIGAGTMASGSIYHLVARGIMTAPGDWDSNVLRVKFGSSLALTFTTIEPDSYTLSNDPWELDVWLTVTTSGAIASTVLSGTLKHKYPNDGDNIALGITGRQLVLKGSTSGTLDTTGSNVVDVTWDNNTGQAMDVTCQHCVLMKM